MIYELAYAKTIGIHNGAGFDDGHFMHSSCSSSRRDTTGVDFVVLCHGCKCMAASTSVMMYLPCGINTSHSIELKLTIQWQVTMPASALETVKNAQVPSCTTLAVLCAHGSRMFFVQLSQCRLFRPR